MDRVIKHIAMYSGGASSAFVAKWVTDKYGKENTILLFTDTLWEHKDNLRFMEECSAYIGVPITVLRDGRTPEEVFFQDKFLGNARYAKCSEELKVRQTLIYIEDLRLQNIEPILYFGIGPHEKHRAESLTFHYEHYPLEPVQCRFPLIDSLNKDVKTKYIIKTEWGIALPKMYELGFHHANCGGRCVRGGLHHYANLFLHWPDVYMEQEEMEERFRNKYGVDVSIMKRDGKPYTLKQHREILLSKMTEDELKAYALDKDKNEIPCICSFS